MPIFGVYLDTYYIMNFKNKISWNFQGRMEQMRRFRRQHEQLRTVIVRVLRPHILNQTSMTESIIEREISEMKPEALAIDGADANAIEEVNIAYDNVKEVDGLDISKEGSEAWEAAMKR